MKNIENKTFSKYGLKRKFGKEFISYAVDSRIYLIGEIYVMFEKVNTNQFKIHPAYVKSYERSLK